MTVEVRTRAGFYGNALAKAHAEAYSTTFTTGFNWLIKKAKTSPMPHKLFDIGCGNGTWMAFANTQRIPASGIEISTDFVTLAKAQGLDVIHGSASNVDIPASTSIVTALGEVLAYKPAALSPCALAVSRALPKGGLFIFDLPGPNTPQKTASSKGLNWSLTARSFISGNTLSRQIHLSTENGIEEETHFQHLFTPEEVSDILGGFGFNVRILNAYGPCDLLPGRFAVLARKR